MLEQFEAVERRAADDGPVVRRGDAPARRRRRSPGTRPPASRRRLGAGRRRAVARRDAGRPAQPGRAGASRSRAIAQRRRCGRISRPACAGCICSSRLGLGACLADDMGLGKTIQVLALLLVLQAQRRRQARPQPPGRAGLAARQLGGGDRALRAEPASARRRIRRRCRPSELEGARAPRDARGRRPGDHQLRLAAARCRGWPRRRGGWSCSTRRRPSRTRPPSRPARSSSSRPTRASR